MKTLAVSNRWKRSRSKASGVGYVRALILAWDEITSPISLEQRAVQKAKESHLNRGQRDWVADELVVVRSTRSIW